MKILLTFLRDAYYTKTNPLLVNPTTLPGAIHMKSILPYERVNQYLKFRDNAVLVN